MCSTCNYKTFDIFEVIKYGKIIEQREQQLGNGMLFICCDMDGKNWKLKIADDNSTEFVIYRCPTCGRILR